MPSRDHDGVLDLFRNSSALISEVMRLAFDIDLPDSEAETSDSTFSELASTEYRADLVLAVGAARVIVEVQRQRDSGKRWSWPVYVTHLAAREKCPVYLVVVTNSVAVARWASKPILLGNRGSQLIPMVLGPESFPMLTSGEIAKRHPELAVLSAIVHSGGEPDLDALTEVAKETVILGGERAIIYTDLVMRAAGIPGDHEVWRKVMSTPHEYEVKSRVFKEIMARGFDEGRQEGRQEGREEGRQEKAAEAVIKVLRGRGLEPSEAEREAILATKDLATLDFWLDHAFHVASAAELLQSQPPASAE